MLNVLIDFAVVVQECKLVWGALVASTRYFFHEHENLVYPRNVLLHLTQVMAQHSGLNAFCGLESFNKPCVFIPNVSLNHLFDGPHLLHTGIEPHNLSDQLLSLGHKLIMDCFIERLKPVSKCFIDFADPMQLRVVRTHHSAVVTYKRLRIFTVELQVFVVQQTLGVLLLGGHCRRVDKGNGLYIGFDFYFGFLFLGFLWLVFCFLLLVL